MKEPWKNRIFAEELYASGKRYWVHFGSWRFLKLKSITEYRSNYDLNFDYRGSELNVRFEKEDLQKGKKLEDILTHSEIIRYYLRKVKKYLRKKFPRKIFSGRTKTSGHHIQHFRNQGGQNKNW